MDNKSFKKNSNTSAEVSRQYIEAVQAIKTAILQGQFEASKNVNRVQLAIYYGVGRYISQHTRTGVWGQGALAFIGEQLRKELPGLRGFSDTNMKLMRQFYEAWNCIDTNSSVATDELQTAEELINTSSITSISHSKAFPFEDFF